MSDETCACDNRHPDDDSPFTHHPYCVVGQIRQTHELDQLKRWKAEALPLLELLDRCHDLLPPDARADLGQSKPNAVERYLMSAVRWWK